ncbi:MAG TPA: hypothetical protein VFE50_06770 [Cyclobacteriaceae bacterium]|nr:hypothetical protein [Cyclobacteriaceae bacterium]
MKRFSKIGSIEQLPVLSLVFGAIGSASSESGDMMIIEYCAGNFLPLRRRQNR